jgi:outer membrane protein OmpA-like peptidoglycan-associated protein
MNKKPLLTILVTALVAAGCASVSTPPPALVEARNTVNAASADPNVLANAPLELKKANDALARADQALSKGDDVNVNHNAYLATQRARTAMASGNAKASEDQIKTAQIERERARADARQREAARARTSAAVAQADARDARADANNQRDQTAIAQQQAFIAQRAAADANNQAAAADARNASLAQQLAALEALNTDRGLVITLGDVLFEFNRAEVRPSARTRMTQLADFLKQYPDRRISIEGHTDNIGSAAYNGELSQRRAEAIKSQLVGLGIANERISTVGYGKDFPVAANDSDTNRAINRRVEVVVFDSGQSVVSRR